MYEFFHEHRPGFESVAVDRQTAAKILGISLATLDRHVRSGKIPSWKLGRRVIFDQATLLELLRSAGQSTT